MGNVGGREQRPDQGRRQGNAPRNTVHVPVQNTGVPTNPVPLPTRGHLNATPAQQTAPPQQVQAPTQGVQVLPFVTYPPVTEDTLGQDRGNIQYGTYELLPALHGHYGQQNAAAVADANSSDQQLLELATDAVRQQLTHERGHAIDVGFKSNVVRLLRQALDQGYVLSAEVIRLIANIAIGLAQIGSDGNGSQSGRVGNEGSSSRR